MNPSNRPNHKGESSSASQSNDPMAHSDVQQWEVEQKYLLGDPAGLLVKLTELGFEQVGVEQHHDTYWQHPARDFRQSDEAFRIRRVNDTACMTYKGPRAVGGNLGEEAPAKTREEIELSIDAAQYPQWLRMLSRLGFQPQPAVVKSRVVYRSPLPEWEGTLVAIDTVEQLGEFVELEQLVRSMDQLSSAHVRIASLAKQLGLTITQPRSYLTLLLQLSKR